MGIPLSPSWVGTGEICGVCFVNYPQYTRRIAPVANTVNTDVVVICFLYLIRSGNMNHPKIGDELRCYRGVRRSCSTGGICRVTLVANPVISHELGKDRDVVTTSGTYPWSYVILIFRSGAPSNGDDCKTFEMMTLV